MDAIEYEYTIKQSDLTSDNVAVLSLNYGLYALIELDNSIGAKAVIFKIHLYTIELAGNIEISGIELQSLEFANKIILLSKSSQQSQIQFEQLQTQLAYSIKHLNKISEEFDQFKYQICNSNIIDCTKLIQESFYDR